MSIQVMENLYSNVAITDLYTTVSDNDLSHVNNFFEVVYGNKPARVNIDLDGST